MKCNQTWANKSVNLFCWFAIFLKFLPFLSPPYSIFSLLKANILQCNIYPKTIYYMEMGNVYYCGMRMSSTTYFLCMNVLQIYFMEIGNVYYCRMSSTTYFLCIETSNFATRGRLRSLLRKQSPYGAWIKKESYIGQSNQKYVDRLKVCWITWWQILTIRRQQLPQSISAKLPTMIHQPKWTSKSTIEVFS